MCKSVRAALIGTWSICLPGAHDLACLTASHCVHESMLNPETAGNQSNYIPLNMHDFFFTRQRVGCLSIQYLWNSRQTKPRWHTAPAEILKWASSNHYPMRPQEWRNCQMWNVKKKKIIIKVVKINGEMWFWMYSIPTSTCIAQDQIKKQTCL